MILRLQEKFTWAKTLLCDFFSESEHSPKKYKIPLEEIEEGEAYIVIVHFADNSTEKSLPAVK